MEGDTLGERERVNVDVFVFKLISRVNIVIKISEIQISTLVLQYEECTLRSVGNMSVLTIRRTYEIGR